jgi:hypothetical protein
MLKVIVDKSLHSSCHGISNIVRSKSLLLRMIWVISISISVGFCSFLITKSIRNYIEYDVVTRVRVVGKTSMELPMITICHPDPFLSEYSRIVIKFFMNITEEEELYNLNKYELFALVSAANVYLSDEQRKKLGFNFEQVLLLCENKTYNQCDIDEFVRIFNPFYGNCYRYNSGYDKFNQPMPIRRVESSGPVEGLKMITMIENENLKRPIGQTDALGRGKFFKNKLFSDSNNNF